MFGKCEDDHQGPSRWSGGEPGWGGGRGVEGWWGFPESKIKKMLVSWFQGFLVSEFLGFGVSWFLGLKDSKNPLRFLKDI